MHSCTNTIPNYKKGFNNGEICFQYPATWKIVEENIDFLIAAFLDEKNKTAVKVSIAPCTFKTIKEIKEITEKDLEAAGWKVKQSEIIKFKDYNVWDVLCDASIENQEFESEQLYILENDNLYCFELNAVNNRDEVITDFTSLIQSFEILKPSYKMEGENYKKL